MVFLLLAGCSQSAVDAETPTASSHAVIVPSADGGYAIGLPPWQGNAPLSSDDEGYDDAGAAEDEDDAGRPAAVVITEQLPDITISAPRYVVDAGAERRKEYCQALDNTETLLFRGFEVRSNAGLHHSVVRLLNTATDDGQARNVFGTTTGVSNTSWFLPPKTVLEIPPRASLCIESHAVNTTSQPIELAVEVGLYLAKPSVDQRIALMTSMQSTNISLPPHQASRVSFDCKAVSPMSFVALVPHTHGLGTRLRVTQASKTVAEWNGLWDVPWRSVSFELAPGDVLHVDCDYMNDTDHTVLFGGSVSDEMCTLAGFYVPGNGTEADVEQAHECEVILPP